ncbi:MAG: alkaline phosphatase family protein [Acidimicrobiales bacterium]
MARITTGRIRPVTTGVACLFVLLASVGGLVLANVAQASSGAAAIPLGDYAGWVDPSGIAAFGATTGTHPTLATDYLDWSGSWSDMDSASGMGGWAGSGYRLVLGVPLVPSSSGATLAQGATGSYNQYFATLAQNLVAEGEGNAILRLGWEFNGTWYPWSVASNTDAQNFAAYWRQIVNTMRAVPGANFAFLWNPNLGGSSSWDLTQAYPGSAYVSYVGSDTYDEYWGTPQTPQNAWSNILSQSWGLNWLSSFAASEGVPIAIPEWSTCIRSDGHGLGDDPYFMNQFSNWLASNNVAFDDIFSFNDTAGGQDNDITDGNFPNALTAFEQDFGGDNAALSGGSSSPTTTSTTAAPTTTTRAPTTTVAPTTSTTSSPAQSSSTGPAHVMLVMMENESYDQVIGSSSMPYTNGLASTYGSATDSYAFGHPSLPNYLDIVSGSNQGVTQDEPPSSSGVFNVPTLATQLAGAGIPAKAYMESLPSDPTNDSGLYVVHHNPWEYFTNPPAMANATSLVSNLDAAGAPDFVWYTPNVDDDADTGASQATILGDEDSFLSSFIPQVQATSWYQAGGQVIVQWDEGDDSDTAGINGDAGGHVTTIVVSAALHGQQDSAAVDTVGVLHSIEDAYGLAHLGGSSADGTIDALLSGSGSSSTTTTTTTTAPAPTTTTTTAPPTTTTTRPPTTTTTAAPTTTTTRPPTTTTTAAPTTTTTAAPTTTTTRPSSTTTTTQGSSPSPRIPAAPSSLVATASGSTVSLSWSNPAGTLGDDVFRDGVEIAWPGWPSPVITSYQDAGVTTGTHTYYVTAYDSAGVGPSSNAVTVSTPVANTRTTPSPAPTTVPDKSGRGYWLVAKDGGVFAFGDAAFYGSTGATHLAAPIVSMAATPDAGGYWLVGSDGGVFAFGDAGYFGSTGAMHLAAPVVSMAPTPDGKGYWLVASDGGVFAFGDAGYFGSAAFLHLTSPVVSMVTTPDGEGYWLVASDGGVFSFGDASFHGSTGGTRLSAPIVSAATTSDGQGYWLVGSDGGVFAFGDAAFHGSTGGTRLAKPIVSVSATPDGQGYWLVGSDGGVFAFGDAGFYGSTGAIALVRPVVGSVDVS